MLDCVAVARGARPAPRTLGVLAGDTAAWYLADPDEASRAHWSRVWGVRGLLWAMRADDEQAVAAVRDALADEHWRVREMALKTVARHRLDELGDRVAQLREDEIARVRAAAERALVRLLGRRVER